MKSKDEYIQAIKTILQYEEEQLQLRKEMANRLNVSILPTDRWGVHISHCCFEHGCKYCDPECPVELGVVDQKYPCESCSWKEQDFKSRFFYLDNEDWRIIFSREEKEN